jgi:hypothetical protein
MLHYGVTIFLSFGSAEQGSAARTYRRSSHTQKKAGKNALRGGHLCLSFRLYLESEPKPFDKFHLNSRRDTHEKILGKF